METVCLRLRPELKTQTAKLLNSEWPRSLAARLISLEEDGGDLSCSLVLVHKDEEVVGHVRLHAVAGRSHAVLVEALLVSREWRGRGLGARLMRAAEEYAVNQHFHTVHLSTHDKQGFYRHLGYEDGPPTSALRGCVAKLSKEQQSEVLLGERDTILSSSLPQSSSLPHSISSHPLFLPPPPPPPPPPLLVSPTSTKKADNLTWLKKIL